MKRIIGLTAPGTLATLIAVGLLIGSAGYQVRAAATDTAGAPDLDGLVRVNNKRLDHVYLLPGADFSIYKRVRLSLVDIAFDREWELNRTRGRPSTRVSQTDMENIRRALADEFRRVFAEELGRSGYTLVDEDGEDVLKVYALISHLYITGPVTNTASPTRTYVANPGRMTLAVEMRDSVTGQLLGRAVDTQQGRQRTGRLQLATPTSNMADARAALREWARVLRTGLDDAEGRNSAQPSAP